MLWHQSVVNFVLSFWKMSFKQPLYNNFCYVHHFYWVYGTDRCYYWYWIDIFFPEYIPWLRSRILMKWQRTCFCRIFSFCLRHACGPNELHQKLNYKAILILLYNGATSCTVCKTSIAMWLLTNIASYAIIDKSL